jgi:hypothetical protein
MQALVLLGFVAQVTRYFAAGTSAGPLSDDMRRRVSELVARCLCSPSIAVVSRAISFLAAPDGPAVFGPHVPMLQATLARIAESHWSPVLRANAAAALGTVGVPRWPPRSPQSSTPTVEAGVDGMVGAGDDASVTGSFASLALSSSLSPNSTDGEGVEGGTGARSHLHLPSAIPPPAPLCAVPPVSPMHAAKVR